MILATCMARMGPGQDHGGAIGELSHGSAMLVLHAKSTVFVDRIAARTGQIPPTPPIWDGNGNMFGTTSFGGIYSEDCHPYYTLGCGTIYEMTPDGDGTWTYIVLHRFMQSSSGRRPIPLQRPGHGQGLATFMAQPSPEGHTATARSSSWRIRAASGRRRSCTTL